MSNLKLKLEKEFNKIPGYSRYGICKKGVVYDFCKGRYPKARRNYRGYYSYSLVNDEGCRKSEFRHRLLGYTYLQETRCSLKNEINHKNGIRGDDDLSNLEWVTTRENRLHAIEKGLTPVNVEVKLINLTNQKEKTFNSIVDISAYLGIGVGKVSDVIKNNEIITISDIDYRLIPVDMEEFLNSGKTRIEARNLITGYNALFDSIAECSRVLDIPIHTITSRSWADPNKLYKDFWQFKRADSDIAWKKIIDPERKLLESTWDKGVKIKDLNTGNVLKFDSQREAAVHLKVSETSVHEWVNKGRCELVNLPDKGLRFVITRKRDFNDWPDEEELLELEKTDKSRRAVIVTNVLTGEETYFHSAASCAKHFGILTTTLNWRLKDPTKVYRPNHTFRYKFQKD